MAVYKNSENGNFYSAGPEFDQPECRTKGETDSHFSRSTLLTVSHQHLCKQLPEHKGSHICDECGHRWPVAQR